MFRGPANEISHHPLKGYTEFHLDVFLTNYDVTRVERKSAEYALTTSFVKKLVQNREKSTNGDYLHKNRKIFLQI